MPDQAYYEVRESPGRGLGLYATVDITAGTRVLADTPLMIIPHRHYLKPDVEAAFKNLSEEAQSTYMSLASAHGQDPSIWPSRIHESVSPKEKQRISEQHAARIGSQKSVLSIMMTNAMPWGPSLEGSAVFTTACRCNHSCVPNAYFSWNQTIQCETIHAVKSIQAGEEITVAYCDPLYDEAIRRRELQHYGFNCDCAACHHPVDKNGGTDPTCFAAASKERKYRLREIDQFLGRGLYWYSEGMAVLDEAQQVRLLIEEMNLLNAEGLVTPKLGNSCVLRGPDGFTEELILTIGNLALSNLQSCVQKGAMMNSL